MTYNNNNYINIPGFPDYYICKETTEVLSMRKKQPFILTPSINHTNSNSTYYMVRIIDKSNKTHKKYIHRLMAENFIDNINNYPEVNHIDGNKHNNNIDNLEWVTKSENSIHAYKAGLNTTVSVEQYDLNGNLLATFSSIIEAERATGVHNPNITKVIKGIRKTAGGFKWKQKA